MPRLRIRKGTCKERECEKLVQRVRVNRVDSPCTREGLDEICLDRADETLPRLELSFDILSESD